MLQQCRPNPVTASAAPKTFIGVGSTNIAECPHERSNKAAIAKKTRLIAAPAGPMPNIFRSLLMFTQNYLKSMLSVFEPLAQDT
jgi:hypothetical protein